MIFRTVNRTLVPALAAAVLALGACGDVNDDGDPGADAGQNTPDASTPDAPGPDAIAVAEAPVDNDSAAAPAVTQFLSITGTRDFDYTDEVSFPGGDTEDFIEFEFPNNSNPAQLVRITLDCTITGQADAQASIVISENGQNVSPPVLCNDGEQNLTVDNTEVQLGRIAFSTVAEPSHLAYTVTVVGFQ